LLRTSDGGKHWVVANELSFANKDVGDGIDSVCPQGDLASLAVRSPNELQIGENPLASCLLGPGMADGDEAPTWSSTNGGASFERASTVIGPTDGTVSLPPSIAPDGAGIEVIGTSLYMRSAPAASPWRDIGIVPGVHALNLTGIDCVNPSVSFVDMSDPGGVGELLATDNGGRTWTVIATQAGLEGELSFATPKLGAMFADGGTYVTSDGGLVWKLATPQT
jgi:hypothetical protein